MAEGGGSRTQIMVAVIGLVSAVTVAVIANWDKLPHDAAGNTQVGPGPAPPPASSGDPAPKPEPVKPDPVDPPADETPAIAGQWSGGDGYGYLVQQNDNQIRFQQYQNGVLIGTADGSLNGHRARYGFSSAAGGTGKCDVTIAQSGRALDGSCTDDNGATYPVHAVRVN